MEQLFRQIFSRYLPAVQDKLDNFEVDILRIENILFHEVTAGAFGSEVDHLVIAKVDKGPWRIQRRNASEIFDAILEPDKFRDHKQVLHDTAGLLVVVVFVDCEVVALLVFEWHVD